MSRLLSNFRLFLVIFFCTLYSSGLYAQTTVSGTVTDETDFGLPGVTILVKGTSTGTITDFQGKYNIEIKTENPTLVFSAVGYQTQELEVGNQTSIDVTMAEDVTKLSEVVVTALGVEREEKALGYSVQKVDGSEIASVKEANPVNALSGKVAGVYITGSGNGPTASANINIRGSASLLGNNQPLFVVNGMPITNDLYSTDDGLNGSTTIDFGNAAQIINSDDIASINVLKGPAASALYGSRAADGVILVETKTGKGQETELGIEINSSTMFQTPLRLPDYQNTYGFGAEGQYSYRNGSTYSSAEVDGRDINFYDAYGENWGPRTNGQEIKQFNSDGEPVPFTPAEGNVRNFFRTGLTTINNVAFNNYSDDSDLRLSYTNLFNRNIVPNSDLKRNTIQASIGKRLFDSKLKVRGNLMYVGSNSGNIPNAGYDESSSVMYGWLWYPRQVPINDLKDYWQPGQEGIQQRYVENFWVNNPWFIANENTNSFQSNRLIGNARINYEINKNFSMRFRYGVDNLDEERQFRRAPSTKGVLNGSYREDEISFRETNAEFLIGYNTDRDNLSNFDFDIKVGGNIMRQQANVLVANNPELENFGTDPSVYTLTNARSGVQVESQKTETGINSLFSVATLSFQNSIFVDASYRQDWNSTLVNPIEGIENSSYTFGYPSVAVSAVISEYLPLPQAFSFMKVRTSYAEVGNGAPPYAFQNTFTPRPAFGSQATFSTSRTIADPNLTNERTRAFEAGLDTRLFEGRARIDLTYYDMLSFNQVITLPVATSSGYDFSLTNGGEISNRGVELMISGRVIDRSLFNWDVTLNAGRNVAIVESLPDVITSGQYSIVADMFPGDLSGADLEYRAVEGEEFGQLVGLGFQRAPEDSEFAGQIIHENGLPLLTEEKVSSGSFQPDVRLGINNSFKYKGFTFSFLFDGQIGGKIYSRSHALYNTGGTIKNLDDPNLSITGLEGRTEYSVSYDNEGLPVYTLVDEGGVVGPGVMRNDEGELVPNDVEVPLGGAGYTGYYYAYYGNGFNRDNIEAATYDATYFKLRELSLRYSLPKSLSERIGIPKASIALVGRNLLLFTQVPTIDPETFSIRNGILVNGFESTQLPSTRSYGVNISLSF
mgnify:CR=1 FL=1